MNQIKWSSKLIDVSKIVPTEKNYKIKTALGQERLKASLKSFGLAGNVVVNPIGGGKFMLIDGNSRLEEAKTKKEKKIWASFPSRVLSPKEFKEMSAMFDYAKAGEVDVERIKQDLGTSKQFYDKYKMEVPLELLNKLGNKAPALSASALEYPEEGSGSKGKKGAKSVPEIVDIRQVQLFFPAKKEETFKAMLEALMKKNKIANISDMCYLAVKKLHG